MNACLLESAERLFHLPAQWHLLQDNSRIHKAPTVKEWLHNHGISVLDFPRYSPDLNPIENLIADLKRRKDEHIVSTIEELQDVTHQEWDATSLTFLHKLVHSMPRRCAAVRAANGLMTKY